MATTPTVPGRPLTQGALVSIDEGVAATMRAFGRADIELRREIERLVNVIALDPTSTRRYRDQQIRILLTRIGTLRTELLGRTSLFAGESLARIYAEGMNRADRIAAAGGRPALGQPSFTLIHRQALEVMAIDAYNDLAAATGFMEPSAKRTIREATKARTLIAAATGEGVDGSTRKLVATLQRRGVSGFVDKAGRNWRLSTYADMVIRTKSAQTVNTAVVLRSDETGTRAFEILDGVPSGHEECVAFNGQTCDSSWGLANPLAHPQCVRSLSGLPLFTGTPMHTAGGNVAATVARERAGRTMPGGLVVRPPDL